MYVELLSVHRNPNTVKIISPWHKNEEVNTSSTTHMFWLPRLIYFAVLLLSLDGINTPKFANTEGETRRNGRALP